MYILTKIKVVYATEQKEYFLSDFVIFGPSIKIRFLRLLIIEEQKSSSKIGHDKKIYLLLIEIKIVMDRQNYQSDKEVLLRSSEIFPLYGK